MSPTIMQGRLPMTVRIAAMVRALALAVVSALAGMPAFAQMTVSLTAPAAGAVYTTPAYVILTASAQNASGSVARVEFYQGATLIGSDNSASYSVPWPYPSPGSYSLSARAIDAQGVGTTSAPVSVTVVDPVAQVYYIHADHLNTPRLIADATGTTVWRWDQQEPFGNDVPNDNPSSLGAFDFPLRFPGQYYDQETNLAYNYFRDYDPYTGRYVQSDPIGLAGGINTYVYVGANSLSLSDPLGLAATNWNNTSGGRSRWDGPTNGNWGGRCWGGGRHSCGPEGSGTAPPTDSGDACYMRHDNCWDQCGNNRQCVAACNRQTVDELRGLPDDSRRWPQPPRPGTEGDSERYRWGAIQRFSQ